MSEPISEGRALYLSGLRREKRTVLFLRAALLLMIFLMWELAADAGAIDSFIFSCPSRMWETFLGLLSSGDLFIHVGTSVAETTAGFLLGTACGITAAIILWWSPRISRVLDPYLVVLNSLPKTSLGPVFIVWMGAGAASIITMSLAISLIVTILDMYSGFIRTDPEKIRLMRTLGASRGQILLKLVLPSNFSSMINALKVNVGLSWVGVIMGEFLVSKAGLGYLIVYGSQVFKMDLVMTTVLILAVCAAVMYRCILWLEKALKKYMGVTI